MISRKKLTKIASFLKSEGYAEMPQYLSRKQFDQPFMLTQFINGKCRPSLKTPHWTKILRIINDDQL